MFSKKYITIVTLTLGLAACGGGGGGSTPTPTPTTVTVTCPNGSSQTAASTSLANAQCPAPQVASISPGNASTTVSVDTFTGVDVLTDSTLDPASITSANVTLKAGTTVVAGTVSTVSTKGFRFTPTSKLSYAQAYAFTATVKDTLGKSLSISSSFTTAPVACAAPTVPNGTKCVIPLAITEYSQGLTTPLPYAGIKYIAPGPDGNMWFTEQDGNRIGRITPTGVITEFSAGLSTGARPRRLAAGADGAMWFTEEGLQRIGRISTNGVITEFSAGISSDAGLLFDIANGPDGNLWFTEAGGNRIGRITPQGVVTEFKAGTASGFPSGITKGPDGNLWFTMQNGNGAIGRITPAGVVTEFTAGITGQSNPVYIVAGPDGNLWFTERYSNRIGRITTAGVITEFDPGIPANSNGPWDITAGSDGNLWFTQDGGVSVWRITTSGVTTSFPSGYLSNGTTGYWIGGHSVRGIAAGPDGKLWLTDDAAVQIVLMSTTGVVNTFSAGITQGVTGSSPDQIITGPDGNLWFVEALGAGKIGRITPSGVITEFKGYCGGNCRLVVGADGALWYNAGAQFGRMTTAGDLTDLTYAGYALTSSGITSGPDGNIWFLDASNNNIGRRTSVGVITTFSNGISPGAGLTDLTVGPDGNLWFTEWSLDRIGRITPAGVVTEFSVGMTAKSGPLTIIAGPDGNLWFTMRSGTSSWSLDANGNVTNVVNRNSIGRITPNGVITEFGVDVLNNAGLDAIAIGPDGNLWFTENTGNRVGRITSTGVITEFKLTGLADSAGLSSITTGPDKKLWFTEKNANKIGNFTPP